jgi:hypothetical protein
LDRTKAKKLKNVFSNYCIIMDEWR